MDVREQYLKNQVSGAPPEKLLLMLVEGGERFIRMAQTGLAKNDSEAAHNNIVKAQDIYLELFCSLDPDGGDFVDNLHGLYYFMYNNLMEANVKKDMEILNMCLKTAEGITKMWRDVVDKYHSECKKTDNETPDQKGIDIRG